VGRYIDKRNRTTSGEKTKEQRKLRWPLAGGKFY